MRFFTASISSGKTAPSLFLHKQLDVTPRSPHEQASFTEMLKWNMLEFCAEPYSLRAAVDLPSLIASLTRFQLNTLESHPCIRRASNSLGMISLQKKVGGGVGWRTYRAKST